MFRVMDEALTKIMAMRVIRRLGFLVGLSLLVASAATSAAQESSRPEPAPANASESTLAASKATTSGEPQLQSRDVRYEIHAGDSFEINFELSPEFNQTVTVQPDGFVTLRGVGDVKVDGQTVPQLTQTLRTTYAKILNDPLISVILKDFQKPYFIADGQIGHPGKYDLRGTVTLTEAIAMAGGFLDSAKHSQVLLFRRVSDQWLEAKLINVKKMEKSGKLFEDPYLHSGDMLFVPKNAFSKFSRFISAPNVGTMLKPY